ncbi:MAG: hypothetical protein ACJ71Q_09810 [Terriglobales bacterium]|jgi:hypothetical protein
MDTMVIDLADKLKEVERRACWLKQELFECSCEMQSNIEAVDFDRLSALIAAVRKIEEERLHAQKLLQLAILAADKAAQSQAA